jgi:4-hydroxy-4-methyl-2-oxoglutarate aldolase
MPAHRSDEDLYDLLKRELFTAVVGDVLDQMGLRRQFLPFGIAPLRPEMKLAGRAMPVLQAGVLEGPPEFSAGPLAENPFGQLFRALDDLKPGEVYIANAPSFTYATWGGLMSMRALYLKAAGAVLEGCVRDGNEIERLQFPVFCRGLYAQDQRWRGKVLDFRCAIEIGGVRIVPGTLVFADREGVLVVPREAEQEAVGRALEKVRTENKVAAAIRAGVSTVEAFDTFGVM